MPGARLCAWRHLGNDQPALIHGFLPILVLRRIEDVDPAGDHADGPGRESAIVRRAIDAAGKA